MIPLRFCALFALASAALPALAAPPTVGGCQVFPADNHWNTPIDALPVHPRSTDWVATVGNTARLHADWGNNLADNFGIPFATVNGAHPASLIIPNAGAFDDESDNVPFPIPVDAPVEGGLGAPSGADRHVLVIETNNCILYELYQAFPVNGGTNWSATSWARFDLKTNGPLRPAGWTSADAAGLPIFPGLVRWEEVVAGEITHAIRMTAVQIWGRDAATGGQKYLWPGRHASGTNTSGARPPMGARFRLKASFDVTPYSQPTRVILTALKKYGFILADGGSNWFFQGVSSASWPDAVFSELGSIAGANFEAVNADAMQVDANSGQALVPAPTAFPRLANISTRMQVLTGNDVLIGGFIIGGSAPKTVVVRARGPSLVPFGIANALANPTLQLVSGATVIATNDDWGQAANAAAIQSSGFAPANAQESAVLATLAPGAYTAIVAGAGGTSGVGIVEVFEVDRLDMPLINIATRGQVLTGNDVMIGGFVIQGTRPQTVLVRARGPSLAAAGIANPLANPMLQLFAGASAIAVNDNWQSATNQAAVAASGFAPGNTLEAAILVTLPPGAYTAIVTGSDGGTGVGIVEVFAL